jgi:hypothetical protein
LSSSLKFRLFVSCLTLTIANESKFDSNRQLEIICDEVVSYIDGPKQKITINGFQIIENCQGVKKDMVWCYNIDENSIFSSPDIAIEFSAELGTLKKVSDMQMKIFVEPMKCSFDMVSLVYWTDWIKSCLSEINGTPSSTKWDIQIAVSQIDLFLECSELSSWKSQSEYLLLSRMWQSWRPRPPSFASWNHRFGLFLSFTNVRVSQSSTLTVQLDKLEFGLYYLQEKEQTFKTTELLKCHSPKKHPINLVVHKSDQAEAQLDITVDLFQIGNDISHLHFYP